MCPCPRGSWGLVKLNFQDPKMLREGALWTAWHSSSSTVKWPSIEWLCWIWASGPLIQDFKVRLHDGDWRCLMVASSWSHWPNLRNHRALWRWWWFPVSERSLSEPQLILADLSRETSCSEVQDSYRSTDQGQDVLGTGLVTLGTSCKQTRVDTDTHTRSHKKNWGGRCTAASISKWPLIIVAVLEQC